MTLLDPDRLAGWLDDQGLEVGERLTCTPLAGGASNAMFVVERGSRRWVLRRPGVVAVERADEGMRREFRILSALEGSEVPHPAPLRLCEDVKVLGRTFYLMEHVPGVRAIPAPPDLDNELGRAEITQSMVQVLAALHSLDWTSSLHDLGRPEGFHERQVERWSRQLASYEGRDLPGIAEVGVWLSEHLPTSWTPSLIHGDFHMHNVTVSEDRPGRVLAVLDWETATIGDPLLDLAGFCEIWTSFAGPTWPGRDAIIDAYTAARGWDDLPDLRYYDVLYNFRMTVLLEGIYQRSQRDSERGTQDAVGSQALAFLGRARELSTC